MSVSKRCAVSTVIVLAGVFALATATAKDAEPAAKAPEAKRTILDRHDQSGVPDKEIVAGTAEFPKGSAIGWHTHSGDEAGYVLRGNLVLKTRGQPDRQLKAGDSFFNARGAIHSLEASPDGDGGAVVSTWIVDKGKPLAEPVK
jgi:quercetin dioxygenase-like cupin family protein